MNDDNDNRSSATQEDESPAPLAGERLAEARREQQIAAIEIAKELHLDEYKVHALERNDFDVIGAPVFAKGHLRKYAQLVKVDEADVMADYYQLCRSSGAQPVLSIRPRPRQMAAPGPWIAVIIVVVLVAAAAAYWWLVGRESTPEPPVTGEITQLPPENTSVQEEVNVADEVDESVIAEPTVSLQTGSTGPDISSTDATGTSLSITFLDDCWTEISDASGRRLFFDLGKAGQTVNLSGEAPFNALFGDAQNVSLVVNGRAFDISPADRRGRMARLTITES